LPLSGISGNDQRALNGSKVVACTANWNTVTIITVVSTPPRSGFRHELFRGKLAHTESIGEQKIGEFVKAQSDDVKRQPCLDAS
jgi:hypothetical protein